jgi:hypothetical protein
MTIDDVITICRERVATLRERGKLTTVDPVVEWIVDTFCHPIQHPKDGTVTIEFGIGASGDQTVELFDADGSYSPDDAERLAHDLINYAERARDNNG